MDNRSSIFKREKDFHTTLYMIEFITTLVKSNLTAIVRSYFLFLCYFPVLNIKQNHTSGNTFMSIYIIFVYKMNSMQKGIVLDIFQTNKNTDQPSTHSLFICQEMPLMTTINLLIHFMNGLFFEFQVCVIIMNRIPEQITL